MYKNSFKKELRATLRLAQPIIVAQLGVILMGTSDNIIVGRLLGTNSLGAAGIANSVAFLIGSLAVGGFAAIAPMVSKYLAEKNHKQLTHLFVSTLIVATTFSVLLSGIAWFVYQNFGILGQKPQIEELAVPFFILIALSNIPMFYFLAVKQFSDGFSKPKIVMVITFIGLLFNIVGDIVLIRGDWIFPEMGLNGAAVATIITRVLMFLFLFFYLKGNHLFKPLFNIRDWKVESGMIREIFSRSIPSGFQTFFEIAAFSMAVVMMGWISETELAAHQIAINVAATTYMMASGFAYAGGIRIGEAWGVRSGLRIQMSGRAAYTWVIAFMSITSILIMLFGHQIIKVFIDDPVVLETALPLLMIAAIFQLSDGVQATGLGLLRGLADIKIPTYITFLAYWIFALPVGYFLAFKVGLSGVGIWLGLLIGLTVSAFFIYFRYRYISRKIVAAL